MSAQRAVLLSVAVLAGIWPLATSRIQVAVLTWPVAALLCGIVLVRIAGRTSDEWASAAMSYAGLRWNNQHKYLGGPFAAPAIPVPLLSAAEPAPDAWFTPRHPTPSPTTQHPGTSEPTSMPSSPQGPPTTGPDTAPQSTGARRSNRSRPRRVRRWRRKGSEPEAAVMDLPGVLAPVRFLAAPMPTGLPGGQVLAVA